MWRNCFHRCHRRRRGGGEEDEGCLFYGIGYGYSLSRVRSEEFYMNYIRKSIGPVGGSTLFPRCSSSSRTPSPQSSCKTSQMSLHEFHAPDRKALRPAEGHCRAAEKMLPLSSCVRP